MTSPAAAASCRSSCTCAAYASRVSTAASAGRARPCSGAAHNRFPLIIFLGVTPLPPQALRAASRRRPTHAHGLRFRHGRAAVGGHVRSCHPCKPPPPIHPSPSSLPPHSARFDFSAIQRARLIAPARPASRRGTPLHLPLSLPSLSRPPNARQPPPSILRTVPRRQPSPSSPPPACTSAPSSSCPAASSRASSHTASSFKATASACQWSAMSRQVLACAPSRRSITFRSVAAAAHPLPPPAPASTLPAGHGAQRGRRARRRLPGCAGPERRNQLLGLGRATALTPAFMNIN